MRIIRYIIILYFSPFLTIIAQSTDKNYVKSIVLGEQLEFGDIIDRGGVNNVTHTTEVTYYDGLGRILQETRNSSGKTVTSITDYDTSGRILNRWANLPNHDNCSYINSNDCTISANSFYGDTQVFSTTLYDALGRIVCTRTAGKAWRETGKTKTVEYGSNAEKEVKWYKAPMDRISLVDSGYYPSETLSSETYIDENGMKITIYKDFFGNKVLERRNADNDTYFVYDDIGRLRYVLQPEYQKSGYKNKYAFEYRYDVKGRLIKKILPGCEYIQYWYDSADRLAFMQDATLRAKEKYRFYLYDSFNRIVLQGLCTSCNRDEETCVATYRKNSVGFLNTGYDLSIAGKINDATLEIVNYYDDYDFLRLCEQWTGSFKDSLKISDNISATENITGCLQYTSNGTPLIDVMYYDYRSRIVCEKKIFDKARFTIQYNDYTFTDKLKSQKTSEYKAVDGNVMCINRNELTNVYDKRNGALLYTNFSVYNGDNIAHTQRIKSYDYDDIGRIRSITHGGNSGTVNYTYNLHGWTTNIDSKDFHEELHYTDGIGNPYYNGCISSILWSASDYGQMRGYKFEYDKLGRLKEAVYGETAFLSDKQNRYNEKVTEYTANGAIKRFQRRGRKDNGEYGKIDNLNIKLDGNKLLNVTDDALPANKYSSFNFVDGANEQVEYEYNGDVALVKDLNRGLSVSYDNFNNPRRINFKDGNSITYTYLPDGTLLSKSYGEEIDRNRSRNFATIPDSLKNTNQGNYAFIDSLFTERPGMIVMGNTEYSGNIIYRNGKINQALFPGGYCTFDNKSNGKPIFHYYTKDHLGNNRIVTKEDGTVEQIVHYYPFGGTFNDAGLNAGLQQYKYNGKELDRLAGLNTYYYGARQYFSSLPTWDRMDPMCEKYYNISPYAFCANNPLRFIDLLGMFIGDYYDENGNFIGNDGIDDNKVYALKTTKTNFESYSEEGKMVKITNISKKQAKAAVNEIRNHSGDISYDFSNVRNSFVMLDGTRETRRKVMSYIKDDGTGGNKADNNREYAINYEINDANSMYSKIGESGNPAINTNISISSGNRESAIFIHSHPSGTNGNSYWIQAPSYQDINAANKNNNYVIAMGEKMIYIYNKIDGIIARLPISTYIK